VISINNRLSGRNGFSCIALVALLMMALSAVPAMGQYNYNRNVNLRISRLMRNISLQINTNISLQMAGGYNYEHELSPYLLYPSGYFTNLGYGPSYRNSYEKNYGPNLYTAPFSDMPDYVYRPERRYQTLPFYRNYVIPYQEDSIYFSSSGKYEYIYNLHTGVEYQSNGDYKRYESSRNIFYISDRHLYYLDDSTPGHTLEYIIDKEHSNVAYSINLFESKDDAISPVITKDRGTSKLDMIAGLGLTLDDLALDVTPVIDDPGNKTVMSSALLHYYYGIGAIDSLFYTDEDLAPIRNDWSDWLDDDHAVLESEYSLLPEYIEFIQDYGVGNGGLTADAFKEYTRTGLFEDADGNKYGLDYYSVFKEEDVDGITGSIMRYDQFRDQIGGIKQEFLNWFSDYEKYDHLVGGSTLEDEDAIAAIVGDYLEGHEVTYTDDDIYYFSDIDISDTYTGYLDLLEEIAKYYEDMAIPVADGDPAIAQTPEPGTACVVGILSLICLSRRRRS